MKDNVIAILLFLFVIIWLVMLVSCIDIIFFERPEISTKQYQIVSEWQQQYPYIKDSIKLENNKITRKEYWKLQAIIDNHFTDSIKQSIKEGK